MHLRLIRVRLSRLTKTHLVSYVITHDNYVVLQQISVIEIIPDIIS